MENTLIQNIKLNEYAMYAIVEIAGQQFKVAKDQKVYVHRLASEEGSSITFDKSAFSSSSLLTKKMDGIPA